MFWVSHCTPCNPTIALVATHAALTMIYPSCGFMHTQTFALDVFHTCITSKTAGHLFSLLTNSQCSVSPDKLIPIIFKYSGGGSSRSSLFSIMPSALNIVYSICNRGGRRLLWSILFSSNLFLILLYFPETE